MKIKNREWIEFKKKILETLEQFSEQTDKFFISDEPENFELFFDECEVLPIFIKKPDSLRVEYDFTLCDSKIRTLALSIYRDTARIEITLKENLEGKDSIWQESKI